MMRKQAVSLMWLPILALMSVGEGHAQDLYTERLQALEEVRAMEQKLETTDSGLKWLQRVIGLGAKITGSEELKLAKDMIGKFRANMGELKKAADKLIEISEQDKKKAEVEVTSFRDKLKLLKPAQQVNYLTSMAQSIKDMPVGLVSKRLNDEYKVPAGLLFRNPAEAQRRFKAYLTAIQSNADDMKFKAELLAEIRTRAKAGSEILRALNEAVGKVMYSGLLTKLLVEQYLSFDDLQKAYNGIASDAAKKIEELKRAQPIEQKRHDDFKKTLDVLFDLEAKIAKEEAAKQQAQEIAKSEPRRSAQPLPPMEPRRIQAPQTIREAEQAQARQKQQREEAERDQRAQQAERDRIERDKQERARKDRERQEQEYRKRQQEYLQRKDAEAKAAQAKAARAQQERFQREALARAQEQNRRIAEMRRMEEARRQQFQRDQANRLAQRMQEQARQRLNIFPRPQPPFQRAGGGPTSRPGCVTGGRHLP